MGLSKYTWNPSKIRFKITYQIIERGTHDTPNTQIHDR